ncbi:hypothetical protein E308F_29730 [Moorella sp. E308F]|nr:hypothetical protein E308F_29730 [Moorella sp. E308F]
MGKLILLIGWFNLLIANLLTGRSSLLTKGIC